MTIETNLTELQNKFADAIKSEQVSEIESVLSDFDQYSRSKVEQETNAESKKALIEQLLKTHEQWQKQILQLKAKVRENLADIKSNGKKINKYLTSY